MPQHQTRLSGRDFACPANVACRGRDSDRRGRGRSGGGSHLQGRGEDIIRRNQNRFGACVLVVRSIFDARETDDEQDEPAHLRESDRRGGERSGRDRISPTRIGAARRERAHSRRVGRLGRPHAFARRQPGRPRNNGQRGDRGDLRLRSEQAGLGCQRLSGVGRFEAEDLHGPAPTVGRQVDRCDQFQHSGPLARAADHLGLPGGQGRLRRKAAHMVHLGRAQNGRSGSQVPTHGADRHPEPLQSQRHRRDAETVRRA